jgi:hypothetical protein
VALSQARILYQNHSGDYPQVILTIPVTCRTALERVGFKIKSLLIFAKFLELFFIEIDRYLGENVRIELMALNNLVLLKIL